MRTSGFLRATFIMLTLAGCGGDPMGAFPPEEDAGDDVPLEKDASEDITTPSFDLPVVDNPQAPDISTIDRSTPTDRVVSTDTSTVDRSTADRAMGICPSSCRADGDCSPCVTPGDPGNYCCISGLCLYMTGACMPVPDGGMTGTPDGSDSGSDSGSPDASMGADADAGGGADGDGG